MKPLRTFTDPLNRDLESRMKQRLAAEPPVLEGTPVAPSGPPKEAEPGMGVSSDNLALQSLTSLYDELLQSHRRLRNLSGELTKRRLTDAQLKDFGMAEDWLSVTKSIARQYGESLIQLEQLLEQLNEGVAEYRGQFGKDPDFLGE